MSEKGCQEAMRRIDLIGRAVGTAKTNDWTTDQLVEAVEQILNGKSPWYLREEDK